MSRKKEIWRVPMMALGHLLILRVQMRGLCLLGMSLRKPPEGRDRPSEKISIAGAEGFEGSSLGGDLSSVLDTCQLLNSSDAGCPRPPPSTRTGAGSTGFFCFGAGNIDSNDEAPAPDCNRGFFAGGVSSTSLSPCSSSEGRVGKLIVIFFGPLLALGGGKARPADSFDDNEFGEERVNVDFFDSLMAGEVLDVDGVG